MSIYRNPDIPHLLHDYRLKMQMRLSISTAMTRIAPGDLTCWEGKTPIFLMSEIATTKVHSITGTKLIDGQRTMSSLSIAATSVPHYGISQNQQISLSATSNFEMHQISSIRLLETPTYSIRISISMRNPVRLMLPRTLTDGILDWPVMSLSKTQLSVAKMTVWYSKPEQTT
jgi:hypothetical protein